MQTLNWSRSFLAAAVLLLAPATLFAQAGETEVGEAGGFAGGVYGIGSHPSFGGSLGTAFSRYGLGLFEASYTPLGSYTMRNAPAGGQVQGSHLYDFNVSVHIRIPVRDRWAPYGILGAGLLWNTYVNNVAGSPGLVVDSRTSHSSFGFHTGAGLRYYVSEKWGVRPEVRVTVGNPTYTRFSVGVFYVLPDLWP